MQKRDEFIRGPITRPTLAERAWVEFLRAAGMEHVTCKTLDDALRRLFWEACKDTKSTLTLEQQFEVWKQEMESNPELVGAFIELQEKREQLRKLVS